MVTPPCEAFVTRDTHKSRPGYDAVMTIKACILRHCGPWFALVLAAFLSACAATAPSPARPVEVVGCEHWFERLDEQVDAHAVRDGGSARVPGFRFLRVDRLLASYRVEVGDQEARWQAWGQRLMALDTQARAAETRNLPPAALTALGVLDAAAAMSRVQDCTPRLWEHGASNPQVRQRLVRAARVPDDYSPVLRTLGLYPLTRWPFFAGVEREQRHWQARWDRAAQTGTSRVPRTRYRPAGAGSVDPAALLRHLPRDALGLSLPDAATAERLLAAYAPVVDIDTAADHDRPGRLSWAGSPAPEVDTREPVVYQRIAHTRVGDRVLLQLVYSLWFPDRPARSGLDLLAGRIDAVVLRLTLDERGQLLLLDSIHGCGCYHVFVPGAAMVLRTPPEPQTEWAFVPAQLPVLAPGQRLRVHIADVDHQLIGVSADAHHGAVAVRDEAGSVAYQRLDDDTLRSLPTADGGHRSAFWSSGIMPGTERGERALFWPMGIASPGAMRQWGRHPTAFVGRRHFDDPRLIGERFDWRQDLGRR